MDADAVKAAVGRMANWLRETIPEDETLVVMGVHRRGVQLAEMIIEDLSSRVDVVEGGTLDITLYRDDLMAIGPRPVVGETRLPPSGIDGHTVVIVDDVLFTGRTVRAALDELADFGRPSRTLLMVLVDRGGRELPIQADFAAETVEVPPGGMVEVAVPDIDGRLGVDLVEGQGGRDG